MGSLVVAGSLNMDLVASLSRLPRPGETVFGTAFAQHPGGKGSNQAVAAAKLGARTVLIGAVGKDAYGAELLQFLKAAGVDVSHVAVQPDVSTGIALISVEVNGQNSIVVVPGANARLLPEHVRHVDFQPNDVALTQFEVPLATVEAFLSKAQAAGATTLLNPAPALACSREILEATDILILNELELAFFLDRTPMELDSEAALAWAQQLQRRSDQSVIVTLGSQGAVLLAGSERRFVAGLPVNVVDTTGAGDAFTGALAACLVQGRSLLDALVFANTAAAHAVQRHGAAESSPSLAELVELCRTHQLTPPPFVGPS